MKDNARNAVLFALNRTDKDKSWSSALIDATSKKFELNERDTAFFSRLFLSTIENKNLCDYYIDYFNNSSSEIEMQVRNILRMSVCQLLFFDRVPAHAAVDSSVELCKLCKCKNASGFVNAILRKISGNIDKLPDIPRDDISNYFSIKYSHPKWLCNYLIDKYGEEFTESFFKANNIAAPLFIHTNTLKINSENLKNFIIDNSKLDVVNHQYVKDILQINNSGDVTKIPGFKEGLFYIQDPAAAETIYISDIKPNFNIWDACSAPGGKSISSALLLNNTGTIISCDIHGKKLNLINDTANRLGITNISTYVHDAREPIDKFFDLVITDVPCSGLGVIRKKPEIREKSYEEISNLPKIQYDIISNCSKAVNIGGTLLYTTCTIIEEENYSVIKKFLDNNDNFELCDFEINNKKTGGFYTFWPHIDNTDGFFVCKLRRIK